GRGFNVPFMNYSGPGNPTNNGKPVNEADRFALIHDIEYAHASYLFHKNRITKEELESRVRKADVKFLESNGFNMTSSLDPREQLASIIGFVGIGVKQVFERVFGQQYPSTDPENTFKEHPQGENKLKNLLMKNLEKNLSEKQKPVEDSSVKSASEKKQMTLPDEDGPSQPKQAKIEAAVPQATAADPANIPQDIEMAQLTGTGKGQASGGASSDGLPIHYIEKPISIFGSKTSTYTKSHKFMTYGLAPTCLKTKEADPNYVLTSYLAEVPWHVPALYLNPSEFALIPVGSKVKQVSVQVFYRGTTPQFETNSSASGLATLNQINDIGVAHGLNRTGWGSNFRYDGFNSSQPMIPTSVIKPTYAPLTNKYRGMVRDYYGSDNNSTTFIDDIPKHQLGRHTLLYNYWGNTSRGNTSDDDKRQFGGWPCLASKITQIDGKTCVNQLVASSTYVPKMAPLKAPLRMQGHGLPFPKQNANFGVPGLGNMVNQRQANIGVANVVPSNGGCQTTATEAEFSMGNAVADVPSFDIYTPIEKSQYMKSGFWGLNEGHIQPSLHVGVQPVPSLSTSKSIIEDGQFNEWTDTRAYWEVTATMVVEEYTPTEWPTATVPNVPAGEVVVWAPAANRPAVMKDPREDGATFAGLYTLDGMPF
ncbi:MAG: hypothetical protein ACRDCC_12215, partial [Culicoidibacterales bacterium]